MRLRTLNRFITRDRIGTILNAFLADQITRSVQRTRNAQVEVIAKFFVDHLAIFISCAAFAYSAFTLTGTWTESVIAQCFALILRLTVAVGSRPTIVTVALTALTHSVSGANFPPVSRARIIVAFTEFPANFLKNSKEKVSTVMAVLSCNFESKKKLLHRDLAVHYIRTAHKRTDRGCCKSCCWDLDIQTSESFGPVQRSNCKFDPSGNRRNHRHHISGHLLYCSARNPLRSPSKSTKVFYQTK